MLKVCVGGFFFGGGVWIEEYLEKWKMTSAFLD